MAIADGPRPEDPMRKALSLPDDALAAGQRAEVRPLAFGFEGRIVDVVDDAEDVVEGATVGEARAVVEAFNASITRQDLGSLGALMTDDHRFVDSGGTLWSGRQLALSAWAGFFSSFPGYRNVFRTVTVRGDVAIVTGESVSAEPTLDGPAIWTAKVSAGRIVEWRVYDDTAATRRMLGID